MKRKGVCRRMFCTCRVRPGETWDIALRLYPRVRGPLVDVLKMRMSRGEYPLDEVVEAVAEELLLDVLSLPRP